MVCFMWGGTKKFFSSPENYGDWRSARSTMRFEIPSLSCGRARWTRVVHLDHGLARVAHRDLLAITSKDLCARKASSRPFGGGGTQGARVDEDGVAVALGAGVRDLRSLSFHLRDVVVIKARRDHVLGESH